MESSLNKQVNKTGLSETLDHALTLWQISPPPAFNPCGQKLSVKHVDKLGYSFREGGTGEHVEHERCKLPLGTRERVARCAHVFAYITSQHFDL